MPFHIISNFGPTHLLKKGTTTLLDKVFEYQGKQVLIHVSEFDSRERDDRAKSVEAYYLLGTLYGSTKTNHICMSKVDLVKDPFDQAVLERIIKGRFGIRGEVNF